jgi:hypothetical protein
VWDVCDAAETRDMRCDRGAILPARGDQTSSSRSSTAGASPESSSNASPLIRQAASIRSSITSSKRVIRSTGSFRIRPSARLVITSPSTIRTAAMPPRSRRRSKIGSSGWRVR